METLPCASGVAQLQEHQQQQQQSDSLVNIKRVSLPFVSHHSLMDTVMTKADEVGHILKEKPQHTEALVNSSAQLLNLSSMDSLCESVVNIPKELILISLVSQEQALYNPKHQLYRSTKSKDEKWSEIGVHVGWTDAQCKAKWKAMRDQYCRELKRAKANTKGNVKWKYFKELDFLRPYALARNYRSRGAQNGNAIMTAVSLPNVITANTVSSNNNNINNSNNNNSFSNSNSSSQNLNLSAEPSKFANIKIEESSASLLENCSFVPTTTTATTATVTAGAADKKTDSNRGLMSAFLAGQIIQQQQHPQSHSQQDTNWNYLTDTNGNGVSSATSITVTCETNNTTAGDTLYNELVDCVNAANAVNQSSTHNHHQSNADEEDDDPIHTFLNMESYFEKELITLIQQEDMIYNYSNQNYRNVKLKLEVWDEIARKLKKPVKQCRQKWKALRDQYAREYKRLKTQPHMDAISRWKHYDSLGFLQKYIQQKSLDGDALNLLLPKHDPVTELEEHMAQSPLRHAEPQSNTLEASPSSSSQLNMPTLPPLTGPHKAELSISMQQQQQEVQQPSELCVASYDEMDIENYINGDVTHDDEEEEEDEDEDMEVTATQEQPTQQQHIVSYENDEDQVYMAVQSVSNTLSKPEQLNKTGSNMEAQQLQQQLQTGSDYSQKLEVHTPTSTSTRFQNAATTPSTPSQVAFPMAAVCSAAAEEDEIGAFFKAVAMKIRNAHLEPVAFTDLQIDILRVINEALRNH
ncbi:bromodomain-containing protein DDB_G0280777 [Drosophila innubila]|uniref:bromodomain-containing protein DDB_G0280777 n=1 Tax=Drosophila innubila TaxID=198719 RepID=UPI00148D6E5B|nr:bromodomain-containing protein DDB_G0280777 [Drosophila innubila]